MTNSHDLDYNYTLQDNSISYQLELLCSIAFILILSDVWETSQSRLLCDYTYYNIYSVWTKTVFTKFISKEYKRDQPGKTDLLTICYTNI